VTDVRYHMDCKATFLSPKSIQAGICQGTISTEFKEFAYDLVVKDLSQKRPLFIIPLTYTISVCRKAKLFLGDS